MPALPARVYGQGVAIAVRFVVSASENALVALF
jgi:hypothetical protein